MNKTRNAQGLNGTGDKKSAKKRNARKNSFVMIILQLACEHTIRCNDRTVYSRCYLTVGLGQVLELLDWKRERLLIEAYYAKQLIRLTVWRSGLRIYRYWRENANNAVECYSASRHRFRYKAYEYRRNACINSNIQSRINVQELLVGLIRN